MLSPPSAKKLSSMPTRSSPRTSANSEHRISSCGVRGPRRSPASFRRRQRSAVKLAVRRQRQPINNHKCRRHHVVRQPRTKSRPQPRRINRAARRRHHIRHQTLLAGRVLPRTTTACATSPRAAVPPQSPQAQCETRAASPAGRHGPKTPKPRPSATAPNPPCGTSGCPPRPYRSATNRSASQTRTPQITTRQSSARYVKLPSHPRSYRLKAPSNT